MDENVKDSARDELARAISDIAVVSYSFALIGLSALTKNTYLSYSRFRANISKLLNFPPQGEIKTERLIVQDNFADSNPPGRIVNKGTIYISAQPVKEDKGLSRLLHLDGIHKGYISEYVDYVPSENA